MDVDADVVSFSSSSQIAYTDAIVRRFATHHIPRVAAHVTFNLAVQAACEAHDARAFAKRVRAASVRRGGAAGAARADARAAGERWEGVRARTRSAGIPRE